MSYLEGDLKLFCLVPIYFYFRSAITSDLFLPTPIYKL